MKNDLLLCLCKLSFCKYYISFLLSMFFELLHEYNREQKPISELINNKYPEKNCSLSH